MQRSLFLLFGSLIWGALSSLFQFAPVTYAWIKIAQEDGRVPEDIPTDPPALIAGIVVLVMMLAYAGLMRGLAWVRSGSEMSAEAQTVRLVVESQVAPVPVPEPRIEDHGHSRLMARQRRKEIDAALAHAEDERADLAKVIHVLAPTVKADADMIAGMELEIEKHQQDLASYRTEAAIRSKKLADAQKGVAAVTAAKLELQAERQSLC
jgi:hypothetical protein